MKVAELKEELAARGLDTSGLKADLVTRLEEAIANESVTEEVVAAEPEAQIAEAEPVAAAMQETAETSATEVSSEAPVADAAAATVDPASNIIDRKKKRFNT